MIGDSRGPGNFLRKSRMRELSAGANIDYLIVMRKIINSTISNSRVMVSAILKISPMRIVEMNHHVNNMSTLNHQNRLCSNSNN